MATPRIDARTLEKAVAVVARLQTAWDAPPSYVMVKEREATRELFAACGALLPVLDVPRTPYISRKVRQQISRKLSEIIQLLQQFPISADSATSTENATTQTADDVLSEGVDRLHLEQRPGPALPTRALTESEQVQLAATLGTLILVILRKVQRERKNKANSFADLLDGMGELKDEVVEAITKPHSSLVTLIQPQYSDKRIKVHCCGTDAELQALKQALEPVVVNGVGLSPYLVFVNGTVVKDGHLDTYVTPGQTYRLQR